MLCDGRDPNVAKRPKVEANIEASRQTFERVAREWHGNAKAQWAAIHASDIIRSLERDVFPRIGSLPIAQLTPPLILGVLREIVATGHILSFARTVIRNPDRKRPAVRRANGWPRKLRPEKGDQKA
ncbi:phage integrase central domain-containing protein [Sphingomonas sanxanigenens]